MGTIRAVVVDPDVAGRLAIREVEAPAPGAAEAIVRVAAISLNRGEVRRAMAAEGGWRPGWDLAGTVERAAADGSGPREGARVVGMLNAGAWAEAVAVPTHALAELPEGVSFAGAATLPIAGLTALHAVEKAGPLLGRNVLVTGASGGVGIFATQLAKAAGARVTGLVRQERGAAAAGAAGADRVVVGDDAANAAAHGPYDLIVDSVGGATLGGALRMLARGGVCVNFGASAGTEATFNVPGFFGTGGATLYGLVVFDEVRREPAGAGLARLLRLVADGRLRPQIEVETPWTAVAEVAQGLIERRFAGKAVLRVGSEGAL